MGRVIGQDRDLSASALDALREAALLLDGSVKDFDPLWTRSATHAWCSSAKRPTAPTISIVYAPRSRSAQSHYLEARVGRQFDAVLHYDVTRAVEPLEPGPSWDPREPPETYPTGI